MLRSLRPTSVYRTTLHPTTTRTIALTAMLLVGALRGPAATASVATFDLDVTLAGSGAGVVTSSPVGIDCDTTCVAPFTENTLVTLTAAPDSASIFGGWSDDCTGEATCVVTMDMARFVTATFHSLTYERLHLFTNEFLQGDRAIGKLIQAADGNFYGTTHTGGFWGCGTVFKIDGSGTFTSLHSLDYQTNPSEGCGVPAGLLDAGDGFFYGTSFSGGAHNVGTLFKIDSNGSFTVLHQFGSVPEDPARPYYELIEASDGLFYGTSPIGGDYNKGSAFRTDSSGVIEVLYSFGSTPCEGIEPFSALLEASDGTFYGTTRLGGEANPLATPPCVSSSSNGGTVFHLVPPSGVVTEWTVEYPFSFTLGGVNGDSPFGALIQTGPTEFYGTTSNRNSGNSVSGGSIFRLDTSPGSAGLYTVYQFPRIPGSPPSYPGGQMPTAALLQASDGNLYGSAGLGGPLGGGVLFRMNAANEVTILHGFDSPFAGTGDTPASALIQGLDGSLYGSAAACSLAVGTCGGTSAIFRLVNADKQEQTIAFDPLDDKVFGDPDFDVSATATSFLEVTFAPSGACTITGTSVHLTGVGSCTITASQAGDGYYFAALDVPQSFDILVDNPALTLTLSPTAVTGGTKSIATVTLTDPAPAGGAVVNLASDTPSVATVPATLTINAGQTTKTFNVNTVPVQTLTPVSISASFGGTTAMSPLAVHPPVLLSVALNPTAVIGGTSSTGTVKLGSKAPVGGLSVTLDSSDPAVAGVGAVVVVAAGQSSATFNVTTTPVAASTMPTISGTWNGVTKTATLTVNPAALTSLKVEPNNVVGGTSSTGKVTLVSPAPAGGASIALASSMPGAAQVNTTVVVPAGQTFATFTITTTPITTTTTAVISASYQGVTKSSNLKVNATAVSSLGLSPSTVIGGASSTATVTLNGPAPAGGLLVTLTSSKPAAAASTSVTVLAGDTQASKLIITSAVTKDTNADITASGGGASSRATLKVKK